MVINESQIITYKNTMDTSHDDLYECIQASLELTGLQNHSMKKL